jgi:hypothetical protein
MRATYHKLAEDPEYRQRERERVSGYFNCNPLARLKSGRAYVAKNRAKINAYLKTRRLKKLQRTPAWLNEDDLWMIEQAYELAQFRYQLTGVLWQVDHIVPLQGVLVSGLHVPHNLRVITAYENRSKSNKFSVTT